MGLQQLASTSAMPAAKFSFEVYQDLQTRATVVLPEGQKLSAQGATCYSISQGGAVKIIASVADSSGDPTGNTAGNAFESSLGIYLGSTWGLDGRYSYISALPVFGGGIARRKDWVHFISPGVTDAQQFETLALHNSLLLGVMAVNSRWTIAAQQTQGICMANPAVSPVCAQALQDYKDWSESVLAVHLSTLAGT